MKNKTQFGVKGENSLQTFMDIAAANGVKYNEEFTPLNDRQCCPVLFFSHIWRGEIMPNHMSYSNWSDVINIDTIEGMIEALNKLKLFLEEGKPRKMTIKEIEDELGYKIDLIA